MYLGRFVIVGPDTAAYRVSSQSFPNRKIVNRDGTLTVQPTADAPPTDNPYVEYNCVRTTTNGETIVLGNGSHVDPIVEKCDRGYPARDALVTSLHALDYEKDEYDTPRVAGVLAPDSATIGIVRRDGLIVEAVDQPTLVATYERNRPDAIEFTPTTAADAAQQAYELAFEHPVCAAGITRAETGFETAIYNGP